jgi:hypothetical protein
MKLLLRVYRIHKSAQGTLESDIDFTMANAVKSLINSGMADILSRENAITAELIKFNQSIALGSGKDRTPMENMRELSMILVRQQVVHAEMTDIINTNAFIRASVQDGMIASLDASLNLVNATVTSSMVSSTPDAIFRSSNSASVGSAA